MLTGKEIKEFRKEWSISQNKMAVDMGISRSKISEYENGSRPIPLYFEKHFRLYSTISTFTTKRVYDKGTGECFTEAYARIGTAKSVTEIEHAIGRTLLCGMRGKRWNLFADLARQVAKWRRLLRFAAERVEEVENEYI